MNEDYNELFKLIESNLVQSNFDEVENSISKIDRSKLSKQNQIILELYKGQLFNETYREKEALKVIEELISIINEIDFPILTVDIKLEKAKALSKIRDFDRSLELISEIDKNLESLSDKESNEIKKRISQSMFHKAYNYHWKFETEKSIENIDKSIELYSEIDYTQGLAWSLLFKGIYYHERGIDLDQAIEFFKESIPYFQEIKNKDGISKAYYNIGWTYRDKGDFKQAFDFSNKCLRLQEEIGNKRNIAWAHVSIAWIFSAKKEFDKAIHTFGKSLEIFKDINNKEGIAFTHSFIASTHYNNSNLKLALENFYQSLEAFKEADNQWRVGISFEEIGLIYYELEEYQKAVDAFEKCYSIYSKLNNKLRMAFSYMQLTQAKVKQGIDFNLEDAVKQLRKFETELNHEVFSEKLSEMLKSIDYTNEKT